MNFKSENDFYFERLQDRYYKILVTTYENIVNQGNDKEYSKFWGAFAIIFSTFGNQNPYIKEIIDTFKHSYKLGYSIDNVLSEIPNLKEKHLQLMEEERIKNATTQYHYKNKFRKFLKLPSLITTVTMPGAYIWNSDIIHEKDNKKILKILIKHFAVQRFFYDRLQTELETINSENLFDRLFPDMFKSLNFNQSIEKNEEKIQPKVKWLGQNKTEFVQLVYALYHAKLITNETNEITKITTDLAAFFDIDLGKNWQSNFSKSKNDRNNDYVPKIFERLKSAFVNYSNRDNLKFI